MKSANAVLLSAAIALGVVSLWRIGALWGSPQLAALPAAPAPLANDAIRHFDGASEPRSWLRPLFSQFAPRSGPSSDVTGTTGEPKAPRLVGVIADGDRRIAVIAYNGAVLRVAEKQNVGSWTVVRVDAHSALLKDEQGSLRLRLDPSSNRD